MTRDARCIDGTHYGCGCDDTPIAARRDAALAILRNLSTTQEFEDAPSVIRRAVIRVTDLLAK